MRHHSTVVWWGMVLTHTQWSKVSFFTLLHNPQPFFALLYYTVKFPISLYYTTLNPTHTQIIAEGARYPDPKLSTLNPTP